MAQNIAKLDTATQPATTPATLLQLAVENNADIDKLERLMQLHSTWEANESRKAYCQALAQFQVAAPAIEKKKEGHNCKYADIDDIAQAIKPALKESGLSYRFEQSQSDEMVTVRCVVTHLMGHSEQTEMSAKHDTSGGKNAVQAIASTVTYLRRYTLNGALGLTQGMEDNDGGKPDVGVDDLLRYNEAVREHIQTVAAVKEFIRINDLSSAKEAWQELSHEEMGALWKAPTKGGVFTTKERDIMKSSEWSEA